MLQILQASKSFGKFVGSYSKCLSKFGEISSRRVRKYIRAFEVENMTQWSSNRLKVLCFALLQYSNDTSKELYSGLQGSWYYIQTSSEDTRSWPSSPSSVLGLEPTYKVGGAQPTLAHVIRHIIRHFDILVLSPLSVCVLIFMTSPLWFAVGPRSL